MEILEQTEIKLEWDDIQSLTIHPEPVYSRSKGLHLSDILRRIAQDTKQYTLDDEQDEMPLRVFLGLAWEQWCVRLYPEIHWQPGELCRDKVYGTPDGLSLMAEIPKSYSNDQIVKVLQDGKVTGVAPGRVEEFKFTHKSCREKGGPPDSQRDIRGDWMWIHQMMGYINMYRANGYEGMNLARLHVCYANGNYTYPLTERYIRYLIRFSEREILGNWKMVKKYKLRML
jgi:hypothetical protein